jgi:multisubunit Na+/H+ antiporter MnhB subunit
MDGPGGGLAAVLVLAAATALAVFCGDLVARRRDRSTAVRRARLFGTLGAGLLVVALVGFEGAIDPVAVPAPAAVGDALVVAAGACWVVAAVSWWAP